MDCATQNCAHADRTAKAALAVAPKPAARWNDDTTPMRHIRKQGLANTAIMSTILSITTDRKKGGIATALASYSAALNMRDHRHIVLLPAGAVAAKALADIPGVSLITMPAAMIRFHLLTGAAFHSKLRAAIRGAGAILVHNANLAPLARRSNRPVCLVSHSGKLRHLAAADHVVFLSQAAAARAKDFAGTNQGGLPRLHIIPHGFPGYEPADVPRPSTDKVRVIAAGRFVPKKGFEILLEAARLLKQEEASLCFDIYGDGPLKPVLANMIEQYGLHNVRLHGWQSTLDEAFAEADLFCLPSLEEPFGLVIGEAMGRGLPMVATSTDGPLDVIGHDGPGKEQTLAAGGLLADPGDARGLAEALACLAGNAGLRATTGTAARRRIGTDFGMDALADRLDRLIATAGRFPPAGPS